MKSWEPTESGSNSRKGWDLRTLQKAPPLLPPPRASRPPRRARCREAQAERRAAADSARAERAPDSPRPREVTAAAPLSAFSRWAPTRTMFSSPRRWGPGGPYERVPWGPEAQVKLIGPGGGGGAGSGHSGWGKGSKESGLCRPWTGVLGPCFNHTLTRSLVRAEGSSRMVWNLSHHDPRPGGC